MSTNKPVVAIVDDDASVGRAIGRLVRYLGMQAQVFVSGHAFLEYCDAEHLFSPDCLVLDAQMPGLTGLDVQREVLRRGMTCPIIVVTAFSNPQNHQQALELGAMAVVFKPFEQDAFTTTLCTALLQQPPLSGTTE
jgi:FixJ family two-component response regulator